MPKINPTEPETNLELVEEVMLNNPAADTVAIKKYVWQRIADDDDWLRSFSDELTEILMQRLVRSQTNRRAENATSGSDKFVGGGAIGIDKRTGKPYTRVGSDRLPIPREKTAYEIEQEAAQKRREEEDAIQRQIDIAKLFEHQDRMSLLHLLMPNKKMLKDCTFAEVSQFSGWFKILGAQGKPHELVGAKMSDDQLYKIRTWG